MLPAAAQPPAAGSPVVACAAEVDGIPMSALLAEADQPRAVIVALHGGAVTSAYFDGPGQPRLSLLRTGAALGFTVIALDRPGYGSSAPYASRMASAAERADLAHAAIGQLLGTRPRGAGVFLVGHSMGCLLTVQLAARDDGRDLLGIEIAGIGRQYQPRAAALLGTRIQGRPASRRPARQAERGLAGAALRDLLWEPGHLYPPGSSRAAARIVSAAPPYEGGEVRRWPRDFPDLAARVRVPVRYSLGDHERVWESGPAALAGVAALFTASPLVAAGEQAGAGHNLSFGLSALAYHLKVLSFAEECALRRVRW